ncbi:potassium voltage-gated channel subfamily B member 2-like [Mytilus trossulus]|uniref:potassium voltage-gated channel subfamily B member 2-like n=1 Tax=Mytilus trossulus TaxID=6551 RepID=UPI0030042CDB
MDAMEESSRIILNISGTKYEVTRNSLLTQVSSRLGQLASSLDSTKLEEIYFNRPSVPFEAILMFYQTGKLHLPPNICPNVFKEELEYWEIDHELMEQCCFLNYIQFLDSYKTKSDFKSTIKQSQDFTLSPLARKNRVWRIIDYQERSWLSKIFLFVGVAFVLLSVSTLALSTLPQYKRTLTTCEWYEYVVADDAINPEVKNYFMKYDCHLLKITTTGNEFQFDFDQKEPPQQFQPQKQHVGKRSIPYKGNPQITTSSTNVTQNGSIAEHDSQQDTLKTTFPTLTFKNDIFYQIDYLATAFFTVELLLRLLVCPSLKVYFMNFLNVIEFVVLIGTYVDIVIFNMKSGYKFSPTFTSLVDFIKFLRVIRLLRYCQHLAAVKVLKFSL